MVLGDGHRSSAIGKDSAEGEMAEGHGEVKPWVEGETVGSTLRKTSCQFPDRDAVVFPRLGLRWSWSELDERVDVVASALLGLGIERGRHVGIWSMNAPEWVVTQFAVGRIGAVLVNINPAYRLHELEETLRMADVETLIVGTPYKGSNFVQMVETLCPEAAAATSPAWTAEKLPALRRLVALGDSARPGWLTWSAVETAAVSSVLAKREALVSAGDVYNIQFTSGTTGLPKGAMLTHRNVLLNSYYIGQRVRYTERDRVCVPVPFYHCFGCVLGTLVCAVYGSALVVPAPTFEPGATLSAAASERCTSLYGVPTMFVAVLGHPDLKSSNLSGLRTGIMAGSPCPLPLIQQVIDTLGAREITIGYGQTEASPIITQTSAHDPIEVRVGTVGRPIPGVEVRLVDPLTRREIGPGETGELAARGHGVMAGYYKNPEATARVIDADGWLYTGDLSRARDDGNYRIVGRSKELIIRGGENIYPPEIEEFLHHHPAIAEVAVVGLPDSKYGEVVSAWIVARSGMSLNRDDVTSYCREQISNFKIPQYVEIVDQLPRTVTGKVRKHVLREWGISQFGLEDASKIQTA
jgi:fatty-acyl-CoA synthase